MKALEKIFAALALISLILKFKLTSGGDSLFMALTLLLACFYFALSVLLFNKIKFRDIIENKFPQDTPVFRIALSVVTGLAISIICTGIIFKLLSLVGGEQMLTIGAGLSIIITLISIFNYIQSKESYYSSILIRTIIFAVLGVFLRLTTNLDIIKYQYRNHPDYIQAYINLEKDPMNEGLRKKLQLERYRIFLSEEELKIYKKKNGL
ncbi:MAG TPA: hypothetical protein VL443_12475 [Cyclobacteriaceae bacterium]|jgi:hypothetical protein|nr:hypothetical protein [Cyclobacteriaceae bacterium]